MISLGWSHLIVGAAGFYGGMVLMGMLATASRADEEARKREVFEQGRREYETIEDAADEVEDEASDGWQESWGQATWTPERRER